MADVTTMTLYAHYWSIFESVSQWAIVFVALTLVLVLDMMSVKAFGEAEFWLAMTKAVTILIFMGVIIQAIITQARVGEYTAGLHSIPEFGGQFPEGLAPTFALTSDAVFAFGGIEMVGITVGEAKDTATILPRAINSATVRIFFFYVGSVVLFALALPYNACSSNESSFTMFFSGLGVPRVGDIVQVAVLTAILPSLNTGLYVADRTLRSMALASEGLHYTVRLNKNHVPYGGIVITASFGLLSVLLSASVPGNAFDTVMDLTGIGAVGVQAIILISYLASLCRVRCGEEQRPGFRMPGTPHTNCLALLFFVVIIASNVTSGSGCWILTLLIMVIVLMVAGWYYVRGRVGNLTDEATASLQDEKALMAGN